MKRFVSDTVGRNITSWQILSALAFHPRINYSSMKWPTFQIVASGCTNDTCSKTISSIETRSWRWLRRDLFPNYLRQSIKNICLPIRFCFSICCFKRRFDSLNFIVWQAEITTYGMSSFSSEIKRFVGHPRDWKLAYCGRVWSRKRW